MTKIAIIKLSSMGDICHSSIVLQFIKKELTAEIDWFIDEKFKGILEHQKDINNLISLPISKFKFTNFFSILRQTLESIRLYKNKYDVIIDLQGLMKSAIVAKLLKGKEKNKRVNKKTKIVGYDKKSVKEKLALFCYHQKVHSPNHVNTILRYLTLIKEGLNLTAIDTQRVINKKKILSFKDEKLLKTANLFCSSNKNKIVLVIGSTSPNRIYSTENWLQFISLLHEKSNKNNAIFIPWGNEMEYRTAKKIKNFCDQNSYPCTVLENKINLNQLKIIINSSDVIIGNDTGPSYIGWAMNKKLILLFGHTPSSRILLNKNQRLIKSSSKVNPEKLDRKDFSINEITPEEILKRYLEIKASSPNKAIN